jgi:hypothetical protein
MLDASFIEVIHDANNRPVATPQYFGLRVCPNPECHEPIFVVIIPSQRIVNCYPAERIDFDPIGVPPRILASFEEAISSHANACYKAAAIMVRRTLEEICADRNATGANLKERIASLRNKITIPQELLEAADELRLLGNDAAHLEATIYDDIGKEEIEVALDLCKEILKAVYQLASLVDRLKALKKS